MKALAFNILLVLGFFAFIAPAQPEQLEAVATDKTSVFVEVTLGPDGEYILDDRSYQLSDLLSALNERFKIEPFTQIHLGENANITIQNIIDVATLAKELAVDAYYRQGGELKRIEIDG